MVSEPREKTLFFLVYPCNWFRESVQWPCFIPITFSISQSFSVSHIVVRKPSSQSTFFRRLFSDDIFDTDHIIRSAKRRSTIFLKAPEPKTDPRTIFLRRPKSHAPMHEGAWPTFWCRASTSRLVRRRLALLSLCQSSPNPASPFFWHFSLHGSSFSLLRPHGSSLPWPRPVCALGRPLLHLQLLFSFVWVPTYQVLLPQLWSDLPLGLSSIQTWFNFRWSGYGD